MFIVCIRFFFLFGSTYFVVFYFLFFCFSLVSSHSVFDTLLLFSFLCSTMPFCLLFEIFILRRLHFCPLLVVVVPTAMIFFNFLPSFFCVLFSFIIRFSVFPSFSFFVCVCVCVVNNPVSRFMYRILEKKTVWITFLVFIYPHFSKYFYFFITYYSVHTIFYYIYIYIYYTFFYYYTSLHFSTHD